jgi:hypothetical protein
MNTGLMAPQLNLPQPTPIEADEGTKALGEASAIAAGVDLSDREAINKFNQLLRLDKADGHMHKLVVCGMYFVGLMGAILLGVIILNKIMPLDKRWLGDAELKDIYQFLFTGGFGGALGFAGKRFLK